VFQGSVTCTPESVAVPRSAGSPQGEDGVAGDRALTQMFTHTVPLTVAPLEGLVMKT